MFTLKAYFNDINITHAASDTVLLTLDCCKADVQNREGLYVLPSGMLVATLLGASSNFISSGMNLQSKIHWVLKQILKWHTCTLFALQKGSKSRLS